MTFCDVLRDGPVTESLRSTRVAALHRFRGMYTTRRDGELAWGSIAMIHA